MLKIWRNKLNKYKKGNEQPDSKKNKESHIKLIF